MMLLEDRIDLLDTGVGDIGCPAFFLPRVDSIRYFVVNVHYLVDGNFLLHRTHSYFRFRFEVEMVKEVAMAMSSKARQDQ